MIETAAQSIVLTMNEEKTMDQSLMAIIEVALQQGIWAALYIYLFFRMLKQNEKREENYLAIIERLNASINEHLDGLQASIKILNQYLSTIVEHRFTPDE